MSRMVCGVRFWCIVEEIIVTYMTDREFSKNIETVLAVLRDETDGDVRSALAKLADDYTMTWVYRKGNGELFPTTGKNVEEELEEVYPIRERKYVVKNIAEGDDVVMVELVESYPDPETGQVYRTPLVLVLEMREGKIRTGRHYCDPALSGLSLDEAAVDKAYKNRTATDRIIEDERS